MTVPYKKKLIEVALPLEAINKAGAREKFIRHGHPSTLHLWWARRPLATARAVIFSQMVDDPSEYTDVLLSEPALKRKAKSELKKRVEEWEMLKEKTDIETPQPTLEEVAADLERDRLFKIIEKLVLWENTTNEEVLDKARAEIWESWRRACVENVEHPQAAELFDRNKLPAFHDPFAGGGALPLEAQRLGLEAYASDLNPVAVLINKAMIEIPPKFAGQPPVNPQATGDEVLFQKWQGAQGLAEDVRYYGQWMRKELEKRIGHLYPKVKITKEMVNERPDLKQYEGKELTVIAWLWARTVKSPNPAFSHVDVPLVSTFMLSTKAGKEAYVEPVIELEPGRAGILPANECGQDVRAPRSGYRFTVKVGKPKDAEAAKKGTKLARGANFRCIMSEMPIHDKYIKSESMAGRMRERLMAIVAEGDRCRVYLSSTPEHESIAKKANPEWKPDQPMNRDTRDLVSGRGYGFFTWADLFTPRQLVALTTFSDLVQEARERVKRDYLGEQASRLQNADVTSALPGEEWHCRGHLPHWEAGEVPQHIVFRLHDSIPQNLRDRWQDELRSLPKSEAELERRKRIEETLDQGLGACYLKNPVIAEIVENALLHFDGQRYTLHAWNIMPNHVHVLATPRQKFSLSSILHSWKSYTAKEANRILNRQGAFWMEEYFDRAMRDEKHFTTTVEYIEHNPVKAGLCETADVWQWSSAHKNTLGEQTSGLQNADGTSALPGEDEIPLNEGGSGAQAYADAVAVYLAIGVNKVADRSSNICSWDSSRDCIKHTFGIQAIPMVWDFCESNLFSDSSGSILNAINQVNKSFICLPSINHGNVFQSDAQNQTVSCNKVISTDPPYYDNICYADLSDFFYVWLRPSLKNSFPDLFATLAVPKAEELVATPYRHGNKEKAESFFLDGMTKAMHRLAEQAHPVFPVTIYYAFKQSETENEGTASTGWETFIDAVIRAGFAITGTWPMRTEMSSRMIGSGTNALASSIVLVCRKRAHDAPVATRREFLAALKEELPAALAHLQRGNIAPVDLAQASIGPGMAVYTRYSKVVDADGHKLSVREALVIINQTLDEALAEQEGDFDSDTRWALAWFDQYGYQEAEFGQADVLARAKNTSVAGLVEAGIVFSKGGKVRLLKPEELPGDWNPMTDPRLTVWEVSLHLIQALQGVGEEAAAEIRAKVGAHAGAAHELAYRLYTLCERKKWAQDALAFNSLVISWPEIERLARESVKPKVEQTNLF